MKSSKTKHTYVFPFPQGLYFHFKCPLLKSVEVIVCCILGDPGAVSGGRESLNGPEKKFGRRKVKNENKSPGDKVLTDQFQTVGAILASDWCQKIFVFFCPITEQQD